MTVANIDNDNCPNADNNMTSEIIWVSSQHTITLPCYICDKLKRMECDKNLKTKGDNMMKGKL